MMLNRHCRDDWSLVTFLHVPSCNESQGPGEIGFVFKKVNLTNIMGVSIK